MSLDDHILTLVSEAVRDAAERASASREVMNREQAREFLGLTPDQWKKRYRRIPRREDEIDGPYWLREDLIAYVRARAVVGDPAGLAKLDYPLDYDPHHDAPRDRRGARESA